MSFFICSNRQAVRACRYLPVQSLRNYCVYSTVRLYLCGLLKTEKFTLFTHPKEAQMAVNLICSECKTNLPLKSRVCKNCGYDFKHGKKYRVVVKGQNGKRVSKVMDSLSMAKKFESKLKSQTLEHKLLRRMSLYWLITDYLISKRSNPLSSPPQSEHITASATKSEMLSRL